NSANVTTNNSVTANGFGTAIQATNNSFVAVNGPVTGTGFGFDASGGSTIIATGVTMGDGGGGGAAPPIPHKPHLIANGITMVWPNGGSPSMVQALPGGIIEFNNSSISIPSGSQPVLLANGGQIVADGLSISIGSAGGMTAAKVQAGGNMQFTDSAISFSGGGGNVGLSVSGANSTATPNNLTISMTSTG